MIPFNMPSTPRRREDTKTNIWFSSSYLRVFVAIHSRARVAAVVAAGLHLVAPVAMLQVPLRRSREAVLERVTRLPAELAADLRRVDRVSPIVARAIGHERLQLAVAAAGQRRVGRRGPQARRARRTGDRRSPGSSARCRRRYCISRRRVPLPAPAGCRRSDPRRAASRARCRRRRRSAAAARRPRSGSSAESASRETGTDRSCSSSSSSAPAARRCGSRRARDDRRPPCSPRTGEFGAYGVSSLNCPLGPSVP